MTAFTLDQLAAEANDENFTVVNKGNGKKFKMGLTYPVEVTKVSVKPNTAGRYSMMLSLGIVHPDGTVGDGDVVFVSLPLVTDEATRGDPEDLQKYKNASGTALLGVLRSLMPDVFAVYETKSKVNGKTVYRTKDGQDLTFKDVEKATQALVVPAVGLAKKVLKGEPVLVGTRAYFVWVPNKNKPEYPYGNFWAVVPDTYPLADEALPF